MFVGGFQHPPNVDAVRYYADEIWPRVRSALPEVKTYIIGSKMTEDLARHGRAAGLEMVGYVPDLEPYLNGCRLSISPLRFGAGVKGKVNQSMSYGLPVVASPVSVEGMSLAHQENILVADTADEFAQAVIRLYTDDELWQRLSAAGLENIKVQFSSETARRALAEMLGLLDLPTRFALAQSA
jgi:glycosyltransferase involved in cell wall biosynthesis